VLGFKRTRGRADGRVKINMGKGWGRDLKT